MKAVSTNGTNTLTCALKLGSVTLAASQATDVANDDIITFEGEFEVKATGVSGYIQGFIAQSSILGGTPVAGPHLVGPSQAIDLSADIALAVYATWSAASTSNQADLVDLSLRRVPVGL